MKSVTLNAYAKINLFLEVLDKRPDNYHNIDSVMQSVSLCDIVTVSKNDSIVITNTAGLPNDEHNLAYKAVKAFCDHTNLNVGADIHIEKNIPISAGLAGGSTDAAAVLKALNVLYETNIDLDTLCKIGAKLGADVPFCIKGGTYITKGIGEIMTKSKSLPECYIVIAKSGDGVSTPYAYKCIDDLRADSSVNFKTSDHIVKYLNNGDLRSISDHVYNIFESVVSPIRPKVYEQKIILNNYSPLFSMMSGSGPSVFGVFVDLDNAKKALQKLKEFGSEAHLCTPIQ